MAGHDYRPAEFSDAELALIAALPSRRVRQVPARTEIISQGDRPTVVNLVVEGWACRYKELPDGRRQMLSIFLPGEVCDSNVYMLDVMDHSVGALTDVVVVEIAPGEFNSLFVGESRLAHVLWFKDLRTIAIQREWTTNIGLRNARERIAHLLCETFYRMRHLGLASDDSCDFPLTQTDLGEAIGLTPVHVNRTLQELRGDGLIELVNRRLRIPNLAKLRETALFDPTYLHFSKP